MLLHGVPGVEDDGVGDDGDGSGGVPVDWDREEDVAERRCRGYSFDYQFCKIGRFHCVNAALCFKCAAAERPDSICATLGQKTGYFRFSGPG